ncbi:hypothetical protein EIN_270360 [Entamoeba invadens IP1]|uniref:Uncharacterized protein n=1 Tax=Entamoeba invadens IP1 TaxID=370355 RepID=A0A0A1UEA7_ENTIV|nr:hypothetical protein EIN_270360 [Entamoeba invadens IP1]ELP91140.1 hypothetical protein EIN_270360 [Entamoeba invadens IP1]|eukprot:XP_004257911.1 hypothetical protein EIN_270360 [Entamoeba invadens IP1]
MTPSIYFDTVGEVTDYILPDNTTSVTFYNSTFSSSRTSHLTLNQLTSNKSDYYDNYFSDVVFELLENVFTYNNYCILYTSTFDTIVLYNSTFFTLKIFSGKTSGYRNISSIENCNFYSTEIHESIFSNLTIKNSYYDLTLTNDILSGLVVENTGFYYQEHYNVRYTNSTFVNTIFYHHDNYENVVFESCNFVNCIIHLDDLDMIKNIYFDFADCYFENFTVNEQKVDLYKGNACVGLKKGFVEQSMEIQIANEDDKKRTQIVLLSTGVAVLGVLFIIAVIIICVLLTLFVLSHKKQQENYNNLSNTR